MTADDMAANNLRLDAMRDHLDLLARGSDTTDTAIAAWMAYATAFSLLANRCPASWVADACAEGEAAARRFSGAPVGGAA